MDMPVLSGAPVVRMELLMNRRILRLGLLVLSVTVLCSPGLARAQGGTSQTLAGTVVDGSGAVIPGADITAKHAGTGTMHIFHLTCNC